ncbi:BspA family leucine-rich repeat surface protein [Mycoplasma cottewii]|uniref:BspA family leucine-rich repeat surface protein n=1 Tax=Mycoplasma cottewii TaxID=51364 RepID=A0ABY5TWU8_9MOLU|nr:BspA family leucine-rich repeat surface protein [Mycoplasma cottewii]UWD35107.1 BspA family leucine-rich repeat surface protein [Mycoplasma cottewii]
MKLFRKIAMFITLTTSVCASSFLVSYKLFINNPNSSFNVDFNRNNTYNTLKKELDQYEQQINNLNTESSNLNEIINQINTIVSNVNSKRKETFDFLSQTFNNMIANLSKITLNNKNIIVIAYDKENKNLVVVNNEKIENKNIVELTKLDDILTNENINDLNNKIDRSIELIKKFKTDFQQVFTQDYAVKFFETKIRIDNEKEILKQLNLVNIPFSDDRLWSQIPLEEKIDKIIKFLTTEKPNEILLLDKYYDLLEEKTFYNDILNGYSLRTSITSVEILKQWEIIKRAISPTMTVFDVVRLIEGHIGDVSQEGPDRNIIIPEGGGVKIKLYKGEKIADFQNEKVIDIDEDIKIEIEDKNFEKLVELPRVNKKDILTKEESLKLKSEVQKVWEQLKQENEIDLYDSIGDMVNKIRLRLTHHQNLVNVHKFLDIKKYPRIDRTQHGVLTIWAGHEACQLELPNISVKNEFPKEQKTHYISNGEIKETDVRDLNELDDQNIETVLNIGYRYDTFEGVEQIKATTMPKTIKKVPSQISRKITWLEGIFKDCVQFNQNINSWDVRHVRITKDLFNNATNFNQPLDSWIVKNVFESVDMFSNAKSFDQNLSSWKYRVRNMQRVFSDMFIGADKVKDKLNEWGWISFNLSNNN